MSSREMVVNYKGVLLKEITNHEHDIIQSFYRTRFVTVYPWISGMALILWIFRSCLLINRLKIIFRKCTNQLSPKWLISWEIYQGQKRNTIFPCIREYRILRVVKFGILRKSALTKILSFCANATDKFLEKGLDMKRGISWGGEGVTFLHSFPSMVAILG